MSTPRRKITKTALVKVLDSIKNDGPISLRELCIRNKDMSYDYIRLCCYELTDMGLIVKNTRDWPPRYRYTGGRADDDQ